MNLNNKGITTIEVILCFVLVVIITMSMYSTISYFNERRMIESYKQEVISYKNEVTQAIQDDLIREGLVDAEIEKDIDTNNATTVYTVNMTLRDSSTRRLIVKQVLTKSYYHPRGSVNVDDEFQILYGEPSNMILYDIPKLGSFKAKYKDDEGEEYETGKIAQDLSINNVSIEIKSERVLSIYIGLYHPELGTRYAIKVVSPIDFSFSD